MLAELEGFPSPIYIYNVSRDPSLLFFLYRNIFLTYIFIQVAIDVQHI